MKKRITALIISFSLILSFPITVRAEEQPSLSAHSAALYSVDTGEFLLLENADERLPMASTTKIMTTLLTLEAAKKDNKTVEFTYDMTAEGSSMGLKYGYKLHLYDLAVGMMTVSGNDAANAAAIAIGGSFEDFADMMNQKAKSIGLKNTNFVTPSGLDDDNHYSTAHDLALLMEYAMCNEDFAELAGQTSVKVDFVYPKDYSVTYTTHNKLLSLYEYCNGGKTGYTKIAGRCLVTSAERDGKRLVAVTLNSSDDWNDHIKMFDYGFSCLSSLHFDDTAYQASLDVVGGCKDKINISALDGADLVVKTEDKDNVEREIQLPSFVYAPIQSGDIVGQIAYKLNGEVIATTDLVAQ